MEMIFCPNCGRPSGFKRTLGFGTLFMVVVTFGLWLLIIPLYPARCINCGLTRSSAFFENLRTNPRRAITVSSVIAGIVLLLLIFSWVSNPATEHHPAPIVKGPNYNGVPSSTGQNVRVTSALQESTATTHQERLAVLREKREEIEREMFVEHEAINEVLREKGIQGIPDDEHEHVQQLIQRKAAIDAAIREEEQEGGSKPESPPPTDQTLPDKPMSVPTTTTTYDHQRQFSVADLFSRREPEIGEWVLLDGYLLKASQDEDSGRYIVCLGDQAQPSVPTTGGWANVTHRASCGVSAQDYSYVHSSYAAGDLVVLRGRYGGLAASSGALLGDCTLIRRESVTNGATTKISDAPYIPPVQDVASAQAPVVVPATPTEAPRSDVLMVTVIKTKVVQHIDPMGHAMLLAKAYRKDAPDDRFSLICHTARSSCTSLREGEDYNARILHPGDPHYDHDYADLKGAVIVRIDNAVFALMREKKMAGQ